MRTIRYTPIGRPMVQAPPPGAIRRVRLKNGTIGVYQWFGAVPYYRGQFFRNGANTDVEWGAEPGYIEQNVKTDPLAWALSQMSIMAINNAFEPTVTYILEDQSSGTFVEVRRGKVSELPGYTAPDGWTEPTTPIVEAVITTPPPPPPPPPEPIIVEPPPVVEPIKTVIEPPTTPPIIEPTLPPLPPTLPPPEILPPLVADTPKELVVPKPEPIPSTPPPIRMAPQPRQYTVLNDPPITYRVDLNYIEDFKRGTDVPGPRTTEMVPFVYTVTVNGKVVKTGDLWRTGGNMYGSLFADFRKAVAEYVNTPGAVLKLYSGMVPEGEPVTTASIEFVTQPSSFGLSPLQIVAVGAGFAVGLGLLYRAMKKR